MWHCYDEHVAIKCLSLPLIRFELVINLSSSYKVTSNNGETLLNISKGWISGMWQQPTLSDISGTNENVGIIFKDCGFANFTRYALHEFGNSFIHISDLWGNEGNLLHGQLGALSSIKEKLHCLEQFLLAKLIYNIPKHQLAQYALTQIQTGIRERTKIHRVCKELKISRKTLNHHLQQYLGSSAATFRRVASFNHLINEMAADPAKKLTHLAYDFNYSDQSHFINDFQSFAAFLQFPLRHAV